MTIYVLFVFCDLVEHRKNFSLRYPEKKMKAVICLTFIVVVKFFS